MNLTRRGFLATAVATAAGVLGTARVSARQSRSGGGATVEDTTTLAIAWFGTKGLERIPAAPLITGIPFNGGLNFDEHFDASATSRFILQPCSRVDDVRKKNVPGTLPLFTILAFTPDPRALIADRVKAVIGFLTGPAGLDPARLRITTTELARPVFPLLAELGIGAEKIRLQTVEKAKREGAGSGFFSPAGHPDQPAIATFSIEYLMADGRELEIAEIVHDSESRHPTAGGIGLERLTMARNGRMIGWNDRLPAFSKMLDQEARRRGVPLPVGYYEILGLPQPGAAG